MNIMDPSLVECRQRASKALDRKDKIAFSEAMFDHRNIMRELLPEVTAAWHKNQQYNLEQAFKP